MAVPDLSLTSMAMALIAGMVSIASPCVLPVVPIIITGTEQDHRYRPLLIVLGLSTSFVLMGVITTLFAGAVAGIMPLVEKVAGVVIMLFGLLLLADVNLFKRFTLFSNLQTGSGGRWSGLIMGLTLGLVWIPCVGPMLSGVLALVATDGRLSTGLLLLLCYSLGFALPMLLLGYASQRVRRNVKRVNAHPLIIRLVSGSILIAFGVYILTYGMLGF